MKSCKGNYKVNNFEGCGTIDGYSRQYGLCPKCLYKWTQDTDDGSDWFTKQIAFRQAKNECKNEVQKKKITRQMKIDLMSNIQYWSSELQPNINHIARLIDQGHPCIATETYGKMSGGHYVGVGANRTISLNLHNIFIQSFHSNSYKGGDTLKYQSGLIRVFGEDYFDFVQSLSKCPTLNITKIEMIEYNKLARELVLELKKDNEKIRKPEERIAYRNYANAFLGIYTDEFSIFNN